MKHLLLCGLLLFLSCAAASTTQDARTPSLTLRTTEVQTFQLVVLDSAGPLTDASYEGTFGGATVELTRTTPTTLSFLVPEVPAGAQELLVRGGRWTLSVTETQIPDPQSLASMLFTRFDKGLAAHPSASSDEAAIEQQMRQYKAAAMAAFASLTPEQQRQVAATWAGNRATFAALPDYVALELDAPTTLARKQSNCSRTADYRTYYECTSGELALAFASFKVSLVGIKDAVVLLTALGFTVLKISALGPAALGLAAGSAAIVMVFSAMAILDTWQAFLSLRTAALAYFNAAWVLTSDTFATARTDFVNNTAALLGVTEASFRGVAPGDAAKLPGVASLQAELVAVAAAWTEFRTFMGEIPTWWSSSNKRAAIQDMELVVDQVSNADVELVTQQGTSATFRTISGRAATFTYRLTLRKEGFEESRLVSATLMADNCAAFVPLIPGNWTSTWLDYGDRSVGFGLTPYEVFTFVLYSDRTGQMLSRQGWVSNAGGFTQTLDSSLSTNPDYAFSWALGEVNGECRLSWRGSSSTILRLPLTAGIESPVGVCNPAGSCYTVRTSKD